MSKHTPGPWIATRTGTRGNFSVSAEGKQIAVLVAIDPSVEARQKANAALIAAAPEMLAALKSAVGDVEEMGCTCVSRSKGHGKDCVGVSHAKRLRAAIAKAEGAKADRVYCPRCSIRIVNGPECEMPGCEEGL